MRRRPPSLNAGKLRQAQSPPRSQFDGIGTGFVAFFAFGPLLADELRRLRRELCDLVYCGRTLIARRPASASANFAGDASPQVAFALARLFDHGGQRSIVLRLAHFQAKWSKHRFIRFDRVMRLTGPRAARQTGPGFCGIPPTGSTRS